MPKSTNPVLDIRKAVNESQEVFAKRLGVNVRSIKRYEAAKSTPRIEGLARVLRELAKEHNITIE